MDETMRKNLEESCEVMHRARVLDKELQKKVQQATAIDAVAMEDGIAEEMNRLYPFVTGKHIMAKDGEIFDVMEFRDQVREMLGGANPAQVFEKDGIYEHAV